MSNLNERERHINVEALHSTLTNKIPCFGGKMTRKDTLDQKLAEVALTENECTEIYEKVTKECSYLTESESKELISLERSLILIKRQTEIFKNLSVEREEDFLDEELDKVKLTDEEYDQVSDAVDEKYKEYPNVTESQRRQAFSVQCELLLLNKKETRLHQIAEERQAKNNG